jgi:hypothetical protein
MNYHAWRRSTGAVMYLHKEMSSVVTIVREALQNFSSLNSNTVNRASTPPTPMAIDMEIASYHGSTLAIEASRERIQAAKTMPAFDLSQMVKERTQQISYLDQELASLEKKYMAMEYLFQEINLVLASVEKVVYSFSKLSTYTRHD